MVSPAACTHPEYVMGLSLLALQATLRLKVTYEKGEVSAVIRITADSFRRYLVSRDGKSAAFSEGKRLVELGRV